MDDRSRSAFKFRLKMYAALLVALYIWLWWCCRGFWLPPPGVPTGDLAQLEARLRATVAHLSGTIGERNFFAIDAMEKAADWIAARWRAQGYTVREPTHTTRGKSFRSLEVEVGGPAGAPIILVGAHYDTCDGPGADDNTSGVAALLELTRELRGATFTKRLRCVAFANEEPPFFDTPDMGSRIYAQSIKAEAPAIEAMLSLESIGYYADGPGSQRYPMGLGHFYGDVGNFVAVVGNVSSRALVQRTASLLASSTDVPVACAALPGRMPGVFWSDHSAFWDIGVSAVMITDTARFRNPRYHTASDTPASLDYTRFARVTAGLIGVVRVMAGVR